jgi:hypothetical protein
MDSMTSAEYNKYELCESVRPHTATLWGGHDESALRGSVAMTFMQASEAAAEIRSELHMELVSIILERVVKGDKALMSLFRNTAREKSMEHDKLSAIRQTNPQDIRFKVASEIWDYYELKLKIKSLADLPRDRAKPAFYQMFNFMYPQPTGQDLNRFDIGTMFITMLTSVIVFEDSSKYRTKESEWARNLAIAACAEFVLLCHLARD